MTVTAKVHPYNNSNPGCMTIESRDGSSDTLARIAGLFPVLADGGYEKALCDQGGRDLLDVHVLHGGEQGNDCDRWDVLVWTEGGRDQAVDVTVARGLLCEFGVEVTDWGVRVCVSPRLGPDREFVYPASYRSYRKLDARAYVARALTAFLNAD